MSAVTFASGLFIGTASTALAMGGGEDWSLLFFPALIGIGIAVARELSQ